MAEVISCNPFNLAQNIGQWQGYWTGGRGWYANSILTGADGSYWKYYRDMALPQPVEMCIAWAYHRDGFYLGGDKANGEPYHQEYNAVPLLVGGGRLDFGDAEGTTTSSSLYQAQLYLYDSSTVRLFANNGNSSYLVVNFVLFCVTSFS
jgi:hypothetical protein